MRFAILGVHRIEQFMAIRGRLPLGEVDAASPHNAKEAMARGLIGRCA